MSAYAIGKIDCIDTCLFSSLEVLAVQCVINSAGSRLCSPHVGFHFSLQEKSQGTPAAHGLAVDSPSCILVGDSSRETYSFHSFGQNLSEWFQDSIYLNCLLFMFKTSPIFNSAVNFNLKTSLHHCAQGLLTGPAAPCLNLIGVRQTWCSDMLR